GAASFSRSHALREIQTKDSGLEEQELAAALKGSAPAASLTGLEEDAPRTRRSFLAAAAGVAATLAAPFSVSAQPPAPTVEQLDRILATLSLEEKVALFQSMGWIGTAPLQDERARHLLFDEQVGAMTVYDYNLGNAAETARMVGAIFQEAQRLGKRMPVLNLDAETGRLYTNVKGATMFPGNMALGAIYAANRELGLRLAYEQGRAVGRELRTWGATWTLAPVIDVNSNPSNPVIANRSIGEDPAAVGAVAAALIKGFRDEGVATTPKHVPDHGDTGFDTHYGMAVDLRPRGQIGGIIALQEAIAAGAPAIMPSHVAYPNAFRDAPGVPRIKVEVPDARNPGKTIEMEVTPATISPAVLGFFRKEMGFNGIIITDALEMGAIIDNLGIGYAAFLALEAGADMFISGTDPVQLDQDWRARFGRPYTIEDQLEAHRVITRAAREGIVTVVRKGADGKYTREEMRITPERQAAIRRRIDESARRVLIFQTQWGLKRVPDPEEAARTVGAPEHRRLAQTISDAAVTLLKADSKRSLKGLPADSKIAVIRPSWGRFTRADSAYKTGFVLDTEIRRRHSKTTSIAVLEPLPEKPESEEERLNRLNSEKALTDNKRSEVVLVRGVENALREVQDADVIVIETNFGHRSPFQQELLKRLAATGKRLVHLVMGNPYDAAIVFKEADIVAVGYSPHTAPAMARLLFEEIKPQGRLPVTVPGAGNRGAGLSSFTGLEEAQPVSRLANMDIPQVVEDPTRPGIFIPKTHADALLLAGPKEMGDMDSPGKDPVASGLEERGAVFGRISSAMTEFRQMGELEFRPAVSSSVGVVVDLSADLESAIAVLSLPAGSTVLVNSNLLVEAEQLVGRTAEERGLRLFYVESDQELSAQLNRAIVSFQDVEAVRVLSTRPAYQVRAAMDVGGRNIPVELRADLGLEELMGNLGVVWTQAAQRFVGLAHQSDDYSRYFQ
ncbi:MAG: glycoside hydrolase family 3 C-terminal domain-containing protein, partial [Candidatus Omnitrophica bacterium]|nr:glycoside hydrolase family 3 C-terminal domain-containing protein [Candidatus Omnitrophota bacterium]